MKKVKETTLIETVCCYCKVEERFGCKEKIIVEGEEEWITSNCVCCSYRKGNCPEKFDTKSHGICPKCYQDFLEENELK